MCVTKLGDYVWVMGQNDVLQYMSILCPIDLNNVEIFVFFFFSLWRRGYYVGRRREVKLFQGLEGTLGG